MIHNTLGIPSLGATGDRWIDAITGQHRVLSKGGAWENIDSKLTHPDEVSHEEQAVEAVRPEAVVQPVEGLGYGAGTPTQADGDHGDVPGPEPEQETIGQIQGTLVDVGIDTDPMDVV